MTKPRRIRRTPGDEGRKAVARLVVARRGELGMTQEGVAASAAVSHRTVQSLEAGETWPQPRTLAAIARALGVDADALRSIAAEADEPVQAAS